jgi:hypothetical protein
MKRMWNLNKKVNRNVPLQCPFQVFSVLVNSLFYMCSLYKGWLTSHNISSKNEPLCSFSGVVSGAGWQGEVNLRKRAIVLVFGCCGWWGRAPNTKKACRWCLREGRGCRLRETHPGGRVSCVFGEKSKGTCKAHPYGRVLCVLQDVGDGPSQAQKTRLFGRVFRVFCVLKRRGGDGDAAG